MIRFANSSDLETINRYLKELNKQAITDQYLDIDPFKKFVVILDNSNILTGFMTFSLIYDRIEIDYIYVDSIYRKKNYGSKLIEFLINFANENEVLNITLEVNVNNVAAIKLYTKYGFKNAAIRKCYYDGIDGYLMIKEMN